jgi:membrane protein insertase Oxa1/YidC/SpoIIIJ
MQENLNDIGHAYKRALVLSALFGLEKLRNLRTSKNELLWIRLCNAFLLFFPVLAWFRAFFTQSWLLLIPLTVIILVLLVALLVAPEEPELYLNEGQMQQYIQSKQWLTLREQALKRDNYCCTVCKSRQQLKVERLTDRHIGNERLHELITICEECYHLPTKRLRKS